MQGPEVTPRQRQLTKGPNMKISAVKCSVCGALHEEEADTYFSVQGNICVGAGGSVIGNNIDDSGRVVRAKAFCKPECLARALGIETRYTRERSCDAKVHSANRARRQQDRHIC